MGRTSAFIEGFEKDADVMEGGLADSNKPADFPDKALKKGIAVEREHTKDPSVAKEIAMDHLKEDPKYYTKLEKMEKSAFIEGFEKAAGVRDLIEKGRSAAAGMLAGAGEQAKASAKKSKAYLAKQERIKKSLPFKVKKWTGRAAIAGGAGALGVDRLSEPNMKFVDTPPPRRSRNVF
jgi:hypothetical protein